jgi:hypothetical protein
MFAIGYDNPSPANLKFNSNDSYFNQQEKSQIEEACRQTSDISRKVIQGLTVGGLNNVISARVIEWFGNSSFRDVVEHAKKMDAFIQGGGKVTFVDRRHKVERVITDPRNPAQDHVIPMTGCDYAYVKNLPNFGTSGLAHVGSGMRLYLGERFFHPSKTIIDRTATIYHELAHKILALSDIGYSPGPCRQLARSQPLQALKNPDNWCLFATSFVHNWP